MSCQSYINECFGSSTFDQDMRKMTGPPGLLFPAVLHKILKEATKFGHEEIISWLPNGRAFKIYDHDAFIEKVLPKYYPSSSTCPSSLASSPTFEGLKDGSDKSSKNTTTNRTTSKQFKWKSFLRQINLYGFERITKKSRRGKFVDKSEVGAYTHKFFRRDDESLCCLIQRKDGKSKPRLPPPLASQQAAATTASMLTIMSPIKDKYRNDICINNSMIMKSCEDTATIGCIGRQNIVSPSSGSKKLNFSAGRIQQETLSCWHTTQNETPTTMLYVYPPQNLSYCCNSKSTEEPPSTWKVSYYQHDDHHTNAGLDFWNTKEDKPEENHNQMDHFLDSNFTSAQVLPSTTPKAGIFPNILDTASMDNGDMLIFPYEDEGAHTTNAASVSTKFPFVSTRPDDAAFSPIFSSEHTNDGSFINSTTMLLRNSQQNAITATTTNLDDTTSYQFLSSCCQRRATSLCTTSDIIVGNIENNVITLSNSDKHHKTMEEMIVENESLLAALFPGIFFSSPAVDLQETRTSFPPKQILQIEGKELYTFGWNEINHERERPKLLRDTIKTLKEILEPDPI